MFFVGEVLSLFFYYTFYRVLFESLNTWSEFLVFQSLHLLSEWILYPLRASKTVFDWVSSLTGTPSLLLKGFFLCEGVSHSDWLSFIALDFGIRCSVMVSTGIGILLILVTIDHCSWIQNSLLQDDQFEILNTEFIMVAVILEIVNAICMNRIFFRPQHVSVQAKLWNCFNSQRFAFLAMCIGGILFINPIFAFTEDDVYKS